MDQANGVLFEKDYLKSLKEQFYYSDTDGQDGERLFFDNSGGSLRLKKCVEVKAELEKYPDCASRFHSRGVWLNDIVESTTTSMREIIFGAKSGAILTELTASQTMFHIVEIIMENSKGNNAVVSSLEHPSAFDAVEYYCKKFNKELRVVPANKQTGTIDKEEVAKYVDKDTCLLSVMSASNVCGTIMDIAGIVKSARKINPDLFIISDAVQHAPHYIMEPEKLGLDAMNFAPYKFFGVRGCGFAWVSDRVAVMPHRKLIAKETEEFSLGSAAPGNFAATMEILNYVCQIGKHFLGEADKKALFIEGMKRIHLHERALLHYMLEGSKEVLGLRHISGVTVHVDNKDLTKRDLIAAIKIDGLDYLSAVKEYEKRNVIVCERTNTSIYSKRIVAALGIDGAIRVSPLHCHSIEDIEKFLKVTAEIAAIKR